MSLRFSGDIKVFGKESTDEIFPFCRWGWRSVVEVDIIRFFINVNVPGALARCLGFHKHRNK